MKNSTVLYKLDDLCACAPGMNWVKNHGGNSKSLWNDCIRPDWMIWYLEQFSHNRNKPEFLLALADIAALTLPGFEKGAPGDARPRNAIKVLRAYAKDKKANEARLSIAYNAVQDCYVSHIRSLKPIQHAARAASYAAGYAITSYYNAFATCEATLAALGKGDESRRAANIIRKYFPEVR